MPCSMLRRPLASGIMRQQQLWPRRSNFTRTTAAKPAAAYIFLEGRKKNLSVRALEVSSPVSTDGDALRRGRIFTTRTGKPWWPRQSDLTRTTKAKPAAYRFFGSRKNLSVVRALEGSSPVSINGDALQGHRIFTTTTRSNEGEQDEDGERKGGEPLLEAILVLAGGQVAGGGVPAWVERRLDKALELQKLNGPDCRIICLGNGTPYRRPVLTPQGFVMHESTSCAQYLINKGAPVSALLKECSSYDTIGNGYFALTQHAIPRRWRRMAVVTSDFHMPRSRAIFEWVFGLQGAGTSIRQAASLLSKRSGVSGGVGSAADSRSQGFLLQYHGVSDDDMEASIMQARSVKERKALESLMTLSPGINTLSDFHEWFHTQHKCYNVEHQGLFGKQPLDDPALQSY